MHISGWNWDLGSNYSKIFILTGAHTFSLYAVYILTTSILYSDRHRSSPSFQFIRFEHLDSSINLSQYSVIMIIIWDNVQKRN